MAATEILPFATDPSADVESQAAYAADPQTATGFVTGIAETAKVNKVWRQSSFMAAGLANFCVQEGVSVPDDGDLAALVTEITTALVNLINAHVVPPFASGTRMIFQQTSAPTGWIKDTSVNDRALRVSGGAVGYGGTIGFSGIFGPSVATAAHQLTTDEIPNHAHALPSQILIGRQSGGTYGNGLGAGAGYTKVAVVSEVGDPGTDATGGGGTHTHGLTMDLAYADVIVAQKA